MEIPLPFEIIPAKAKHTATIIFLHGLGSSTATWLAVMQTALAKHLPHVLWIFPQAPNRYIQMNRFERPGWFNINKLPPGNDEFDETSIEDSISVVERLILWQVHEGIDSKRIVLAGFSQGAVITMLAAFTTLHDLGGVASLSGWLPHKAFKMIHSSPSLPILWCHGGSDEEIPISMARSGVEILRTSFNVQSPQLSFRTYETLEHKLCDEELNDFGAWLANVIG